MAKGISMQKKVVEWHGEKYYLLGRDSEGINYYLKEPSWDCDWYWGGGYIVTFTNNRCPAQSRDFSMWTHFDSLFMRKNRCIFDEFNGLLVETPFERREIWKITELMRSFYIARQYSDMLHCGGAHQTENPCAEIIKSEDEYWRINHVVIPAINKALYRILELVISEEEN